jgi:predicted ester cyclase
MEVPGMDAVELARLAFRALETGDAALSRRVLTDDHVNHMAAGEPPACREHGAPGFAATSAWLRLAFSGLSFEELDVAASGERVFSHVRMAGVHTGPFVVFAPGGRARVFPATGRRFSVRQVHLFRVVGGRLAEHVAVRDDLGMMTQLGFIPPRPAAAMRLLGLHLAGGARRCAREAARRAEQAARQAATTPAAPAPPPR